ncbi:DUF3397 family protein [Bhargavaea ullalensis]|uniref:ABC-type proline/glycine betaine transport system permease subunit n=1 Tax=Bhargavaea ullalensis TaxID=1265685 RepID=A0ABV2GC60_9BACL
MAEFLFAAAGFLLAFPPILFMVLFIVFTRLQKDPAKGLSRAADVTTLFLLPAVPIVVRTFAGIKIGFPFAIAVTLLALAMTWRERRTQTELEIIPLLRKIWRVLFLLCALLYGMLMIAGTGWSVWEYTAR